jgi:hypothetical protein
MRRIRDHLTYANVMATLAVFLVLGGGSAVALSGQNTVQSDDLGPGAQVKAADVAANAVSGAKIVDGSVGGADLAAGAKGARAYGVVGSTGTLNTSRSKNITSVSHPTNGIYCLTIGGGITLASVAPVLSSDYNGNDTIPSNANVALTEWDSSNTNCPSGTLEVRTYDYNGDQTDDDNGGGDQTGDQLSLSNEPFQVVIP